MTLITRNTKDKIVGIVKGSFLEKPFYFFKLQYDLLVMNKSGKNYLYDRQTLQIIKTLSSNSNCIDIGCHKGDILKEIIKVNPGGKHFAFEPIDELYNQLKVNFKNVELFKIALSDTIGKTTFYNVTTGQGVSGLKKRDYDRKHSIVEIQVETNLLDNIIPEAVKVAFIKIDIEGGEYDAMRGGERIIKNNKPIIVFEFEKGVVDKYNVTPNKLYNFLVDEMGMKLNLMKNWIDGKRDEFFDETEFVRQFEECKEFYFIAYNN